MGAKHRIGEGVYHHLECLTSHQVTNDCQSIRREYAGFGYETCTLPTLRSAPKRERSCKNSKALSTQPRCRMATIAPPLKSPKTCSESIRYPRTLLVPNEMPRSPLALSVGGPQASTYTCHPDAAEHSPWRMLASKNPCISTPVSSPGPSQPRAAQGCSPRAPHEKWTMTSRGAAAE